MELGLFRVHWKLPPLYKNWMQTHEFAGEKDNSNMAEDVGVFIAHNFHSKRIFMLRVIN